MINGISGWSQFRSVSFCSRYALRAIYTNGKGSTIKISFSSAIACWPQRVEYDATKTDFAQNHAQAIDSGPARILDSNQEVNCLPSGRLSVTDSCGGGHGDSIYLRKCAFVPRIGPDGP